MFRTARAHFHAPLGQRSRRVGLRLVPLVLVAALVPIALPTGASSATTGLVAAYGFDEGSGLSVGDASGSGNAGSLAGASWVAAGRFGSALSFNGSSAWVTVPDSASLRLSSGMTVEAWVRPASTSNWRSVLLKEGSNTMSYALYATDGNGRPPSVYAPTSAEVGAVGTTKLALNTWAHLAGTYDGSNLRLYVNGVLVRTVAQTGSLKSSSLPLRIGGNAVWGEYFSGLIDEVRVYNRALTAADITTDMNQAVGR